MGSGGPTGWRWRSPGSTGEEARQCVPQDRFEVFARDLPIPDADHAIAGSFEQLRSSCIVGFLSDAVVRVAFELQDEPHRDAVEVHDEAMQDDGRLGWNPNSPSLSRTLRGPTSDLRPPSPEGRGGQGVRTERRGTGGEDRTARDWG